MRNKAIVLLNLSTVNITLRLTKFYIEYVYDHNMHTYTRHDAEGETL